VAVEIGGALLELGEVLDGLQPPLRAEEPLDVHPPQGRRLDPVAELLWTDVSHQVRRAVRAPVLVAVEAGDAEARTLAAPIGGEVELLLGERRHEQPQSFQLLGIEDPVEELVVVVGRDEATARDVTEIGARRQVDRRGELRKERIGEVEVEVETGEVSTRLLLDLVGVEDGKHYASVWMIGMRKGQEPRREYALLADLLRRHLRQDVPGDAGGQLRPDAALNRLASAHGRAGHRTIAQVVP